MRFLCKKCGAHSPGDLSGVEIRDGALVFTCKACGASATLVESRSASGAASAEGGEPAEEGIVEPDEEELVDLGEATLSRMLGKKVRIVAESVDASGTTPAPPGPAEDLEKAAESEPEPALPGLAHVPEVAAEPENGSAPVVAADERPLLAFATEPEAPLRSRSSRIFLAVAASVALVAVATVALLEARPQRSPAGSAPAIANRTGLGSAPPRANEEPASGAIQPGQARAGVPSAAPGGPAGEEPEADEAAPRIELREKAIPTPPLVAAAQSEPGLSSEQVEAAFFRVRPAVRMCALKEQRRNPDAKLGPESVTLTVAPSGEVTRVDFERPEIAGTPLEACLTVELKRFRVEAFTGQPAVVRRILDLSRSGASPS